MATWTYADWIQLDDPTARLTRLRLHITEVSQRVMGTSTRSNSVTAADQKYLDRLRDDEADLTKQAGTPVRLWARNKAKLT